ncbi:unnamed protein product [Sphagnum jensenii]
MILPVSSVRRPGPSQIDSLASTRGVSPVLKTTTCFFSVWKLGAICSFSPLHLGMMRNNKKSRCGFTAFSPDSSF